MDWTGLDQSVTLSNAAFNLSIYGSLTLAAGLTWTFTGTGYLYFRATSAKTITTNGVVMNPNRIFFDGIGGAWTNQDDWINGSVLIYPSNGTWDTNNKTINCTQIRIQTGTFNFNFRASLITGLQQYWSDGPNNGSKNFGTSTLRFNSSIAAPSFSSHSIPYNLEFISPDTNTYYIEVWANFTVANNVIIQGFNAQEKRTIIRSQTIGGTRTITINGTLTASNVDFRDIVGAGTASWHPSPAVPATAEAILE
jgi:hypothetical protein